MSDNATPVDTPKERKVTKLRTAQGNAERFFQEVEARELIQPGITESRLDQEIYNLPKRCLEFSHTGQADRARRVEGW